jgi:hypothetical protein
VGIERSMRHALHRSKTKPRRIWLECRGVDAHHYLLPTGSGRFGNEFTLRDAIVHGA